MSHAVPLIVCTTLSLLACGCDDVDWPDPRYVDSIRVLAVRAEPPTLTPGASTRLTALCVDGSKRAAAPPECTVEVAWFTGCDNPEQNDPDRCLEHYASMDLPSGSSVAQTPAQTYPAGFKYGVDLDFPAPAGILTEQFAADGQPVRFGTSYVFFALCAGRLTWARTNARQLPLSCHDAESGAVVDQRRFVVGVTTIYTYDRIINRNPEILAPQWNGTDIPDDCDLDADCPAHFACGTNNHCIPVVRPCAKADPEQCEEHCLSYGISGDSFHLFALDGAVLGAPRKSLWLDYLTNAGRLPADDAGFGLVPPQDETSTRRTPCIRWQAPTTPTDQAYLWTVIRDSRGGASVAAQQIFVR